MPTLKQKDPTFFIKDATLCRRMKDEDLFGTGDLVEKFYGHLLYDENTLYESSIFAVLAPTGNGKTFFLAMLYCLLQEKNHTVRYINVLDYIVEENTDEIMSDIKRGCSTTEVSIVLIDNIEKHSPQFIVDFIYKLDKTIQSNKILAVLAYDDTVVQQKLLELYKSGNDTEEFFQRFIDIEFFLILNTSLMASSGKGKINLHLNSVANPTDLQFDEAKIEKMITEVFQEIVRYNLLTITQIMLFKKKLEFFFQNIIKNSSDLTIYLKSLPTICFFIFFKLYNKQNYKQIQQNLEFSVERIEDQNYKTLYSRIRDIQKKHSGESDGYDLSHDVSTVLKLMELHNV